MPRPGDLQAAAGVGHGERQACFDPKPKGEHTERIVCSAELVVKRSQRPVLLHQRASGFAPLQQIAVFIRACRDSAEVWIGLDGSAMG
jgi:hypothetical protein